MFICSSETAGCFSESKFWRRVIVGDGCWIWTGATDTRGYGHLRWRGRIVRAHRLAYELVNGPIPAGSGHHGMVVRHSCDRRICCNPEHLLLGTQADNAADLRERGRRKGRAAGSENGRAVLSSEDVIAILSDERGTRKIAAEYGVSRAAIQRIKSGVSWRCLVTSRA